MKQDKVVVKRFFKDLLFVAIVCFDSIVGCPWERCDGYFACRVAL